VSVEDEAARLIEDLAAVHQRVIELKNRARRLTTIASPVWGHLVDAEIKLWDAQTDLREWT
jgi:hypothetical protein